MENKNILVTGATGGIGGGITKLLLEHGYTIHAPVRDVSSADKKFESFPNKHNLVYEKGNVEDIREAREYIEKLRQRDVHFMMLILAAGTLIYDHEFVEIETTGDREKDDQLRKEIFLKLTDAERAPLIEKSKKANYIANAVTKENIIIPYSEFYDGSAKETLLELIGSQAAGFPEGHPWRFDEEGYHFSHVGVREIGKEYGPKFKDWHVAEPELIDTPMTRIKFALNDDGTPRDWTLVPKPDAYAAGYLKEIGLI